MQARQPLGGCIALCGAGGAFLILSQQRRNINRTEVPAMDHMISKEQGCKGR